MRNKGALRDAPVALAVGTGGGDLLRDAVCVAQTKPRCCPIEHKLTSLWSDILAVGALLEWFAALSSTRRVAEDDNNS